MLVKIAVVAFILLELSNVLALYFAPGSKYANAIGVFRAWEKSKQYPEIHDLVRYLVNWVAGAKLIFLFLLAIIIFFADMDTQRMSLLALALATTSFYWRLFPLIRKLDQPPPSVIHPLLIFSWHPLRRDPHRDLRFARAQRQHGGLEIIDHLRERSVDGPMPVSQQAAVVRVAFPDQQARLVDFLSQISGHLPRRER